MKIKFEELKKVFEYIDREIPDVHESVNIEVGHNVTFTYFDKTNKQVRIEVPNHDSNEYTKVTRTENL